MEKKLTSGNATVSATVPKSVASTPSVESAASELATGSGLEERKKNTLDFFVQIKS